MQRTELLKKMLPGFIPLFVFIIIDEIWGTRAGLIAAIVIGMGELLWIGIREKRFDRFVLFDTLLLVIMGGISIILNNDIFFKLKPGLVELILCTVLALSAFSNVNVVALMSKRYMKDIQLSEEQMQKMKESLKLMFYVFLVHTILVFYAVFYLSDGAWAFISGGLFYLLFGAVFVYELIRQKISKKKLQEEEQLPLVNEQGKVIGRAPRSLCHDGKKLLHPVVHLHILNRNNTFYLQKRPLTKLIQPGKWDTAVGGHIAFGEDVKTALQREAWEEIGLKDFSARFLQEYIWESDVERELVYVFITSDSQGISIHSEEVEEGRFWTRNQIVKNLGKSVFTPNFEHEYRLLFHSNSEGGNQSSHIAS